MNFLLLPNQSTNGKLCPFVSYDLMHNINAMQTHLSVSGKHWCVKSSVHLDDNTFSNVLGRESSILTEYVI